MHLDVNNIVDIKGRMDRCYKSIGKTIATTHALMVKVSQRKFDGKVEGEHETIGLGVSIELKERLVIQGVRMQDMNDEIKETSSLPDHLSLLFASIDYATFWTGYMEGAVD